MLMNIPKRLNFITVQLLMLGFQSFITNAVLCLLQCLVQEVTDRIRNWIKLRFFYVRCFAITIIIFRFLFLIIVLILSLWKLPVHVSTNKCSACVSNYDAIRVAHRHNFEDETATQFIGNTGLRH